METDGPSRQQLDRATTEARKSVEDPRAPAMLRDYYDPAGNYAGSTFLDLSPNPGDDLTATDLYALSLLDVRARPRAGRRLLEPGSDREVVLAALANPRLPQAADLATADAETFAAATTLYLALKQALGVNPWVTASKLCARKRPMFFPVRDSVVTEIRLGIGAHYLVDWKVYQHLLADQKLRVALRQQVAEAETLLAPTRKIHDPLLRVLDVLLWMTTPADLRRRNRSRAGTP